MYTSPTMFFTQRRPRGLHALPMFSTFGGRAGRLPPGRGTKDQLRGNGSTLDVSCKTGARTHIAKGGRFFWVGAPKNAGGGPMKNIRKSRGRRAGRLPFGGGRTPVWFINGSPGLEGRSTGRQRDKKMLVTNSGAGVPGGCKVPRNGASRLPFQENTHVVVRPWGQPCSLVEV